MKTFILPLVLLASLAPFSASAAEPASDADPVLVTVNGVAITENEFRHFVSKLGENVSPNEAIQEMINVELINQAARNEALLNDPTLQMEIKRNTAALIASSYLKNHLNTLHITDQQVEAKYKAKYLEGNQNTEYNANHILVKTEGVAQGIIKQLQDGADFEGLAKTLSTGPSGKNGGSLGWFKKGDMVPPFSEATMQLEKGQFSKNPVQTQFGWHVILLKDVRQPEPPAIESVRKELATAIAGDSVREKLRGMYDSATIEFTKR